MQLERGSIVTGRYRLERPLAQGAMGCVWVARHLQLDVDVAIKLMAPGFAESNEARIRFEREAKASALLKVPNAVHVYDYGIEAGSPFLVMELLEGEDLAARLRQRGRLSLAATLAVLEPVGKALRRAREIGLVHRDLKPGNIFLARSGGEEIVKVVDFGIAKAAPALGLDAHATKTGSLLGSPSYMSPEQIRHSNHIDHRSDLWSLGVIAFECVTGQVPFPGDEIGEVLVDVCTAPIPRPGEIAPDLGPEVDRFFERALMRDPNQRFQSAGELVEAFATLVRPGAPAPGTDHNEAAPERGAPGAPLLGSPGTSSGVAGDAPTAAIGTLSPSGHTQAPRSQPGRGGTAAVAVLSALGGAAVLGTVLFFVSRGPSAGPTPALSTPLLAAPSVTASAILTAAPPSADSAAAAPSAASPPSAAASSSAKPRSPVRPGATPTTSPKKKNDLLDHM